MFLLLKIAFACLVIYSVVLLIPRVTREEPVKNQLIENVKDFTYTVKSENLLTDPPIILSWRLSFWAPPKVAPHQDNLQVDYFCCSPDWSILGLLYKLIIEECNAEPQSNVPAPLQPKVYTFKPTLTTPAPYIRPSYMGLRVGGQVIELGDVFFKDWAKKNEVELLLEFSMSKKRVVAVYKVETNLGSKLYTVLVKSVE